MSRFLQYVHVGRYGGMSARTLGPFGPGMNVVYGPNEAGKSTVASLIGSVLFGWEDAHDHGVRNTYRPDAGDRSGKLVWGDDEDDAAIRPSAQLSRDEQGATGDLSVLDDIDVNTYETIFSLTADELRQLRNSSDVTARLLTAGTGTASNPATAFVEVEQRIAALTATTRAQAYDGREPQALAERAETESVFQLEALLESKQEQMKAAASQTELLIQEDRELRELKTSRASTTQRIDTLNAELEQLITWRAQLESMEQRTQQRREELDSLQDELDALAENGTRDGSIDARLLEIDSATERALRDKIDEFSEAREKLDRMVDVAKENSSTSSAAYEALCEIDDENVAANRKRNRPWQAVVSVLLPFAFIVAGIPLFIHGRQINSLSISALGIGLVVAAVFLAAATFVFLFRNPIEPEALENRRKDAQWVMLQDRKKLDSCLTEREELDHQIAAFFDSAGLAAADGSLRQARLLLDEAQIARSARTEDEQKASAMKLRVRSAERDLDEMRLAQTQIADEAGLPEPQARLVDALIRERTAQRDALLQAVEDMSQRFGELDRKLDTARHNQSFDQLKLECQLLRTRLREAKHELVSLLLAKRMLDRSIATWEQQSQPEVYDQASRLLTTITDGQWTRVSTSATGSLIAVAADGTERDPRHLSLGTCQQLYLALRLALLITSDDVGKAIPVLADDILVNFDANRRRGAARALSELASHRQVIVFTCHKDTASALREETPAATCINL